MTQDLRQFAPAVSRNREIIFQNLKDRIPAEGSMLEIASGTGEHAAYFTVRLPELTWQPTNFETEYLISTEAWRQHTARKNFLPGLQLDASSGYWPTDADSYKHAPFDALFNANMIHISPWSVCEGLFAGAARMLADKGQMYLYGPFKIEGKQTSESNIEFEKWLKTKDPSFGVRDIEAVCDVAERNGLKLLESVTMPANNFIQVFTRS
jgi:Protein of unknown function (DUF938)